MRRFTSDGIIAQIHGNVCDLNHIKNDLWTAKSAVGSSGQPSERWGQMNINDLPRRRFLCLAALAAPAVARVARAESYPTRPVRIIVGFAAGGPTDTVARLISQWLSERLSQQFIVENRTGATTNIATETVARASADGYTLLLTNAANAINATLYQALSFNFVRDIVPVAGISLNPLVMEVDPSLPATTVPAFVAYAKANPGRINFASGGVGAPNHMAAELFKSMAGHRHGPCAVSRSGADRSHGAGGYR
jgi:tripartite-type tricarboxylate transporter receptor subunit TctC